MGGMSDVLEISFLQTNFVNAPLVYLALTTTIPTDASSGTEVTGGSYARQLCAFPNPAVNPLVSPTIIFPIPTVDWGVVLGWAIFTQATGGIFRAWNELPSSINITTGKQVAFILTLTAG